VYGSTQLILLFTTGLAAGFVDSIAGGGGLLTLPVILNIIPDPKFALGTNKLQSTFGSASAAGHYAAAGLVSWREALPGFLITAAAAAGGALALQYVDNSVLKRIIPIILGIVAVYALFKPSLGDSASKALVSRPVFDLIAGLSLGFYDGFFGPGTGTFWTIAFVMVAGFNLTRATASTKVANFASNVASLAVFLMLGQVYFVAGFTMGAGQILGARLGSRLVVKQGAKLIRPIFIAGALALTLKLIFDSFHGPAPR
jgi:uncharacterized membrane protein YfcA